MEAESSRDGRRKRRRRRSRRRRSEARERSGSLSTLVSPIKHVGASPAEDEDTSSSGAVKQNQNHRVHMDTVVRRRRSSADFLSRRSRALKRKRPFCRSHQSCKRASWTVTQKNALVQLNELRPGLQYHILSESGPLHAPLFSVGVEVNGSHFEGRGPTKKQAKMRAAELALQSFIQFPNAPQAQATMGGLGGSPLDFTANNLDVPDALLKEFGNGDLLRCSPAKQEVFSCIYNHRRLVRFTLDLPSSTNPRRRGAVLQQPSPVVLLNQLRPGLRYACLTERRSGRPRRSFVMVLRLEGRAFEGLGHSKTLAKAAAAAAALRSLYDVSPEPERRIRGAGTSQAKNQLPQFFAESIFRLVREKYSELTDGCLSTSHARHKALAGIVMTRGLDLRSAQVVTLATGSRSLDAGALSACGRTLSDCHAEVVGRRALVRFLYAQLELLLLRSADVESRSIFILDEGGGLRLQDGVLFHMYVSSSPCGDARVNCPYEASAAGKKLPSGSSFLRRRARTTGGTSAPPSGSSGIRGRLRSKVSGGEGTLSVTARRANQKPLASMSCTDKMAKWSAVGLQGALLSHLVEPVYLHSLTVGTLGHTGHLSRAVTRRLAPANQLPPPYRCQPPLLGCLGNMEVRPAGKSPGVSLNWSLGDEALEEVSSSTGRTVSGTPSRLCRRSLFGRWLRLQQLNPSVLGAEAAAGTYGGHKMAAGGYQRAVQRLHGALQGAGLGTWRRKPAELSSFSV